MSHPEKNAPFLLLAPAACGWRAVAVSENGDRNVEERTTFPEVVTAAYALAAELRLNKGKTLGLPVKVALPVRCGVFERLTLPAIEQNELRSMVRLQFEKNLPYPIEETSLEIQVLSQTKTETTLMACAASETDLSTLCAPILEHITPQSLTFWAMHVAAQAPSGSVACGIWREEDNVFFGVFENSRLGFVETLHGGGDLRSALPGVLMRAEIAGAPTEFTEILLDPSLEGMSEAVGSFLSAPVRQILPEWNNAVSLDMTPEKWRAEQTRRERRVHFRRRIAATGCFYVVALAAAFIYLGVQNKQIQSLRKEANALQPQVDAVIDRQTRWKALAPAVDKRRFGVELLFQTWQCLPSAETRITRFELARNQIAVEGEAPDAQQAIAFAEKLKAQPELADYRFESGPPVLLPNEHAQFRIFGKQ